MVTAFQIKVVKNHDQHAELYIKGNENYDSLAFNVALRLSKGWDAFYLPSTKSAIRIDQGYFENLGYKVNLLDHQVLEIRLPDL